jgi:hypothetical protein
MSAGSKPPMWHRRRQRSSLVWTKSSATESWCRDSPERTQRRWHGRQKRIGVKEELLASIVMIAPATAQKDPACMETDCLLVALFPVRVLF